MGRLTGASVLVAGILGLTGVLVLAQTPAPAPAAAPATPAAAQAPAAPAAAQAPAAAPAANPPGTVKGTPANDTVKGAKLLADARNALGGEDKFKAVQRLELKGKSARQPQGNFTVEGDFEYSIELPDKFRHKENLALTDISISILQVLNGQEATTKTDTGGSAGNIGGFDDGGGNRGRGGRGGGGRNNDIVRFLTGGAGSDDPEVNRKALATQMARLVMALTLSTTETVAWIGIAESPDGRGDVLEFKTPDGVATHLVLDEKTHLPLMLTWIGPQQSFSNNRGGGGNFRGGGAANFPQSQAPNQAQQQGRRGGGAGNNTQTPQMVNLQMHLSAYKTVSGMKFPHLIQSGANNETTEELVVKNLRVNPSFRADLFTGPK